MTEVRERLIKAVEKAVIPLQGEGIYMDSMYYTTEPGGRVHGQPHAG